MNKSQDFDFSFTPEITSTLPTKLFVCTTGLTKQETQCYDLPDHIVLQERLTLSTNYLITHKCTLTPKYIQAYKWKIPILKPSFLHNGTMSKVKLYEGLVFCAEESFSEIYKNYFLVQGAVFSSNLTHCTDFFISDSPSSEQEAFCFTNGIPIIKRKSVFLNNLELFVRKSPTPLLKKGIDIFSGIIFLLDERMNKNIFNKLKRLILKNEGRRVSLESDSVNFILTDKNDDFFLKKEKLLSYNFIFDCDECRGLILPEIYSFHKTSFVNLFNNSTFFISLKEKCEITNKIVSLGGKVVSKMDNYVNYVITGTKSEEAPRNKTVYWLDECLSTLKLIKEIKIAPHQESKRILYLQPKRKIFQFTGLPSLFKNRAKELLKENNIFFVDSEAFYHEKEKTTHLIMGKISTSEKFLSAVANGCFILKPEFIDHFDNSENFNYSKYEWVLDDYVEKGDRRLIGCIRPWRKHVASTNKPAFFNWRVKLYCEDEKKESYQRVIVNGGGVLDDSDFNLVIKSKGYQGNVEEGAKSTDYIFLYLYRRQE